MFNVTRLLFLGSVAVCALAADLEREFAQTVRPFVATYCVVCHSGATPAAGLDFKSYKKLDDVIRDYPRWNLVLEKLSANQMPPKPMKQPPAEARQAVIAWVEAVRANEARKNAGDPGIVLARRLSNAEYNYTIRDLTGVDIEPTREFPVDPANTEGFDNSGESLTMSPALLNKYLQAARAVANQMVLTADGFVFAPYPMLVETDREKFPIQRIVGFYDRQPTDYAAYFQAAWRYKYRAQLGRAKATLADVAAESKVSAKYLPRVWGILEETPDAVGPIAKLQGMWRGLPAPGPATGESAAELAAKCVAMRDFVVRIRKDTAMQFAAPVVPGLPATSQPLLNWKYLEFNSHRRDSDPAALRNDTDPPPVLAPIPVKYPGGHREAAFRWAAVIDHSRADDPDLVVPAAERDRYQAAFARFASVFPDAFYVKERGRYFPDDSQDKGRLLSAGYHNVMGYWHDDTPLQELILDEKGKQELDRLWEEFDFMADYTARTWVQYYFNESGEVLGKGSESGNQRPSDKAVTSTAIIFGLRDAYLAVAKEANNPVAVEAIRRHFQWENNTIRGVERMRVEAEPRQREALVKFAARAYRRPLTQAERERILAFYTALREKSGMTHEEAIRESIVSVLMSPKFCYRIDLVNAAAKSPRIPLSGYDLASRLSYFLWSSMPDEELLKHATAGDLQRPEVLMAQARRMLQDDRARGLAVEFGGNWLDFRRFDEINTVDRDRFPSFTNELREAMFEEPVRFLQDVMRNDRSILDLVYGNYTFVNPVLAKHYGMPLVTGGGAGNGAGDVAGNGVGSGAGIVAGSGAGNVAGNGAGSGASNRASNGVGNGAGNVASNGDTWVRVDDAGRYGRGGLLAMAAFLTENAPGLRTSPVKRGYWVVKRVLGETIPPPPPNVPELPHDEAKMDLPLRDMLAQHRANPACAGCHARFDGFGLAFEGYGPVGERRTKDLAGHPVDAHGVFPGGGEGVGLEGVEAFIREHRQQDFVENFCRKLLAYALGRSLILSDEATVEKMTSGLAAGGYRFGTMIDAIVTSPQFRNERGPDLAAQKRE